MSEKKYAKCPECGAPCEVIEKMDVQDCDGDIVEIPYIEHNYQPRPGAVWVKGAPQKDKPHYAKVPSKLIDGLIYKAIIIPKGFEGRWWAVGDGFAYDLSSDEIIEHLDESPAEQPVREESDVVEFAEWIEREGFWQSKNDKKWRRWTNELVADTTIQLYQLFKEQKPSEWVKATDTITIRMVNHTAVTQLLHKINEAIELAKVRVKALLPADDKQVAFIFDLYHKALAEWSGEKEGNNG